MCGCCPPPEAHPGLHPSLRVSKPPVHYRAALGVVFADLASRQVPLGAKFAAVFEDNLDALYEP